jgi:hypothetical protein
MGKTIHKEATKRPRIPDTEATLATRLTGGAIFGASVGALVGVPGAVIGGLAGAAILGSTPYVIVLVSGNGKNGNHAA